MKRVASRLTLLLLLFLAAAGMVLQAGSVAHVHADAAPGIYNEEHDLTLMAGLSAQVILVDAAPAPALEAISALLAPYAVEHAASRVVFSADSRAPPLR